MENLAKGELIEELLRNYFLNLGYYVVRGVKYKYEGNDITDVDLYLYGRSSSLIRERINVDIKNKKSPQAFERILWANGLKKLLFFDNCIIATTDTRQVIHTFGQIHDTIVLDGNFISKIKKNSYPNRLSEEDLGLAFSKCKSYKSFGKKDWRYIYEDSKSKLLSEMDYAGFNSVVVYLRYFTEKVITDVQKREEATRMLYILLSHLLVIMDFIIKDIAFLDSNQKIIKLKEGLNFGILGKAGVSKILQIVETISGKSSSTFYSTFESQETDILSEFFSKNENSKILFQWSKLFESLAFEKELITPDKIDTQLRSVMSLFLDFFKIDRKRFFNVYSTYMQTSLPLDDKKI